MNTQVEVNVEKIMEEIRAEITAKGLDEEIPPFDTIREKRLEAGRKEFLSGSIGLDYYHDLDGTGIRLFLKRVIRKLMRPVIFPIVEAQTEINANCIRCISQLAGEIAELKETNEELSSRVAVLEAGQPSAQERGEGSEEGSGTGSGRLYDSRNCTVREKKAGV